MAKLFCENNFKIAEMTINENVLDAFDKISVELPQGCRSGSCGVCAIEIKKGIEHFSPPVSIESNTLSRLFSKTLSEGKSIRLACRAMLIKETSSEIIIQTDVTRD